MTLDVAEALGPTKLCQTTPVEDDWWVVGLPPGVRAESLLGGVRPGSGLPLKHKPHDVPDTFAVGRQEQRTSCQ